MNIDPAALSGDGYIIDQRKLESIPFGRVPSSKNGCGWIAAYNFLKALERDPDPEKTLAALEKTLLLGGRLGLNFFALAAYLHRQKIPMKITLRPFHAQELMEKSRAGIILYRTGKHKHFAAFRREETGKLRFFGAVPGNPSHLSSMAEFRWNYVNFPLTLTMIAE